MKKVLLVATVQSHICQFHKPLVEMLHEKSVEVHVAARDNLAEKNGLKLDFVEKVFNVPFQRSPFSFKNIKAYKMLKKIINEGEYDVIHCNTPVGGILTRMAAKKVRKCGTKVFYTAHGFHFYKGAPLKNWLVWYPIEKHFAKKCDKLITINDEDYNLAKKKFKTEVVHMHGVGLDIDRFVCNGNGISKSDLGLNEDDKIILSVGELNPNKNHQVIIRALSKIEDASIHYVICGNGPMLNKLKALSKKLGVEQRVHFMGYRRDLMSFYSIADIFAFPSKREGLGLAPLEAMSFGLPIVTSNKHGINDYSIDGETGFKCEPNDYLGFADRIMKILTDKKLIEKFNKNNKIKVWEFDKAHSINELERIYKDNEKSCCGK